MTFQQIDAILDHVILAEGDITPDTPGQFSTYLRDHPSATTHRYIRNRVLLNSLGGSLGAGLELGLEIRRAGLDTSVATAKGGSNDLVVTEGPAECASACTFTFLGGVRRRMSPGSRFGVHRFWGLKRGDVEQETQKVTGGLVDYIREMGVSAELYTLMTEGSPDKLNYLDLDTMSRLNVITHESAEAKLTVEHGVSVLHLTETGSGRPGHPAKIDFYCNRPNLFARGYLESTMIPQILEPPRGFIPSQLIVSWLTFPGGNVDAVPADDLKYLGWSDGKVMVEVYVPPAFLRDRIKRASHIAIDAKVPATPEVGPSPSWSASVDSIPGEFRTLVQTVADSCY